jgi:hypothetical protein
MDLARAREILAASALDDTGSFYGSPNGLSLGVGLIVSNVEFPVFDPTKDKFAVQAGLVYILSHECDLEPTNERLLNGAALVCPILQLKSVLIDFEHLGAPVNEVGAFLGNVAARRATRCVYMPPISNYLPDGGILNLNLIASTSVSRLKAGETVAAITAPAMMTIDMAIEQHLRRSKSERLPLSSAPLKRARSIR